LVKTGQSYEAFGAHVTALAYYAEALEANANSDDAQKAWALAYRRLSQRHRLEAERLESRGQALRALGRITRLEELSGFADSHSAAADLVSEFDVTHRGLIEEARTQAVEDYDARAQRGTPIWTDVRACRQAWALQPKDTDLRDQCERLAEGFRFHVRLDRRADGFAPSGLLRAIANGLRTRPMDRVDLASRDAENLNAILEVYVARPEVVETPWFQTNRRSHRAWIPKLDARGKHMVRKVVVKPTAQQIAKAKKAKKPAPEAKVIYKKLYKEVEAESRTHRRERLVKLVWSIRLRDLKEGHERYVSATSGVISRSDDSTYGECLGDPRACPQYLPRNRAKQLASVEALAADGLGEIPEHAMAWIVTVLD